MTTQADLDFALKMYGQAMVAYAKVSSEASEENRSAHDNMVFWHNQAYFAAQDVAEYGAEAK